MTEPVQQTASHLPVLIIAVPFMSAFVVGVAGLFRERLSMPLMILALAVTAVNAIRAWTMTIVHGPISYHLGGWDPPFGVEFVLDPFNGMVVVVIASVALLSAIHSIKVIETEHYQKLPQLCGVYLLLVTGLLGMTSTGDVFNVYVFLEISSLTMYTLIAFSGRRAYVATFHYLVMGSIGATFYLLGVGYLYLKTGSLNMADLHGLIAFHHGSKAVLTAFVLIILGMWIKMAFFPLHGWLPNAYRYAPNPISCLIAPLSTKVSVYVMIRLIVSVFGVTYVFETLDWQSEVVTLASIGIVAGSILALAQKDLKRMFAYIIVAEVGYMVGGVWLANRNGLAGAGYHIFSDAMMTLSLFMFASILVFKAGGHTLEHMRGAFKKMPFTMAGFMVAALSMIGVPPTCGFFSKWYLLSGAVAAGRWEYVAALIFSSLVNAILFFKIIEYGFFSGEEGHGHDHGHEKDEFDEAPISMLAPFYVVCASLILIGLYAGEIIENAILPILRI